MGNTLTRDIRYFYAYKFFSSLQFFTAVLVPFFTDWGHISMFQIQLLQSWFAVALFVMEVPTGVIADRLGYRASMIAGTLLLAPALLIYGSFPNIWVFAVAELLFATAYALQSGADEAWLYERLKQAGQEAHMKAINGKAHSFLLGGILVGGPVGSVIASHLGLNAPTLLSSLPALAAAGILYQLPKVAPKTTESVPTLMKAKENIRFLATHPKLRRLTVNLILVSTAAYFTLWFYQPLLSDQGIAITWFGLIHASLLFSEIAVNNSFHVLEKVFGGPRKYLQISALLVAVSFGLVAAFPHIVTICLFLIIGGGFGLTRLQFATDHIHQLIPSADRAGIRSALSMFRRLAIAIANPIVGYIATRSVSIAILSLIPLALWSAKISRSNATKK